MALHPWASPNFEASIKNFVIFYVVFGMLDTIGLNARWSIIWLNFGIQSAFFMSFFFCDRSDIERSLKFRIFRAAQFVSTSHYR